MPDVIADLALVNALLLAERVSMSAAIAAVQSTLRDGFDPEHDLARQILDVPNGQLLLMPAAAGGAVGQKFATVAPGNPVGRIDCQRAHDRPPLRVRPGRAGSSDDRFTVPVCSLVSSSARGTVDQRSSRPLQTPPM